MCSCQRNSFNEHYSVAGCATNHDFRFCLSCDFALTSFGVAHCICVNDDILYFWTADLRRDSNQNRAFESYIVMAGLTKWLKDSLIFVENIFISSEERSPKVRSSKIWVKHALQSLDKNEGQSKYTQSGSLSSLNILSFPCDSMYLAHVLKRSSVNSFCTVSVDKKVKVDGISQGNYSTHKNKFLGYTNEARQLLSTKQHSSRFSPAFHTLRGLGLKKL